MSKEATFSAVTDSVEEPLSVAGSADTSDVEDRSPKRVSVSFWLMAVILVVGALLRLNHLMQPFVDVFSWRQTSTAMIARNFAFNNPNIFFPEVDWSGPGPNYQGREFQTVTYIASLLYRLFGQHDWMARAVVIAFGIWGIFALYRLVRLVWDPAHGLAAAAVMALLPGGIFIDRSFLPDPAMVALMVTSCWMLLCYLKGGRPRYLVLAAVTACLGMLTKLPGAIVALPMLYAAFGVVGPSLLVKRGMWKPLMLAGCLTILPVVLYYLWARHLSLSYPPYHFAGSANWLWMDGLTAWIRENYFLKRALTNFIYWLWTPPVMALFGLGFLIGPPGGRLERERPEPTGGADEVESRERSARWFFHVWLLGAGLFYAIGARELIENPWNFHIFNPAVAAIAGRGVIVVASFAEGAVRRSSFVPKLRIAAVLAVVFIVGQFELGGMYRSQGEQARRMGLALRSLAAPDELVVTIANDIGDPVAIYYSQRRGWVFPPAGEDIDWSELPANDDESIRMFDDLRAKGADWFGVVSERKELWTDHRLLVAHLNSRADVVSTSRDWTIYRIRPLDRVESGP